MPRARERRHLPHGPYPHDEATDNAIDMLSHELAEIATNPWHTHAEPGIPRSWYADNQGEIGDLCRFTYGPRDPVTGADVFLNGRPYLIQEEWSNADDACSLAPSLSSLGIGAYSSQEGYGQVKPATVFSGGDPTSLVERIHWTGWGRNEAIGHGTGDYVWPGESFGSGSTPARAVLVAWDLGSCGDQLAYKKVTW